MELSWCDSDVSLSLFLERFKPPQVVQIAEGAYGNDEETTLSRGQELNLHLLKDMRFFSGFTELGEEIHIPFNSPHKFSVFSETSLKKDEELSVLFPKKYPYILCSISRQNLSDPTEVIEAGDMLKTLYFDKDTQTVICLDKRGCELSFGMDMFEPGGGIIPLEKYDGVFIVEVGQRFSLPLTVQFMPQSNSSVRLVRGFIYLKQVIVKQTVIATTCDTDTGCKTILTFPSTLDVTVLAPKEAVGANPAYFDLCKNINRKVNLKKVEEVVEKDEQIYDDVKASVVKAIPYAEAFFGSRAGTIQKKNDGGVDLDGDGYMLMDEFYRRNDNNNDSNSSSNLYEEPIDVPILKQPPQTPEGPAHITSPTLKTQTRDIYGDGDDDNYEIPTGKPGSANCYSSSKRSLVVEPGKKAEDLTVQEVGMLLHDLNLGQYGEMFENEQVDGKILIELPKELLQSHFSMTSFHAHKLMKAAMENWRPTVSK